MHANFRLLPSSLTSRLKLNGSTHLRTPPRKLSNIFRARLSLSGQRDRSRPRNYQLNSIGRRLEVGTSEKIIRGQSTLKNGEKSQIDEPVKGRSRGAARERGRSFQSDSFNNHLTDNRVEVAGEQSDKYNSGWMEFPPSEVGRGYIYGHKTLNTVGWRFDPLYGNSPPGFYCCTLVRLVAVVHGSFDFFLC